MKQKEEKAVLDIVEVSNYKFYIVKLIGLSCINLEKLYDLNKPFYRMERNEFLMK